MNKRELLTKLRSELRNCDGYDGDNLSNTRTTAFNYYFQRSRGDEVIGRSQVVSGDFSSMVEATLAQMMNAYAGRNIAEYDAFGAEDETQAQLETDTVQHLIMGRNNGFLEICQAVKNALMLRNGLMKVYVEQKENTETRSFTGVTPEAAAEIINIPNAEVKVLEMNPKKGTLRISVKTITRKFCTYAVAPENFLLTSNWNKQDLEQVPFCCERIIETRQEAVDRGFDEEKVLKIKAPNSKTDELARRPRNQKDYSFNAITKMSERIEYYVGYPIIDGERRQIYFAENVILEDEPYASVPYVSGCVIVNPNQWQAISLFDKTKWIQDINTALLRGLLDNINTTNKPRTAHIDGKVNIDDLSDGRPNGSIRVDPSVPDIRAVLSSYQVPDTSGSIVGAIEVMMKRRSEAGGASLDLATGQMQLNDRLGSQGLDRAYSVMEQIAELMTRVMGATLIRSLFLKAHATLRREYSTPVPVKRNGRWMSAIPAQWPARESLTINAGMSPGERTRRVSAILKLIDLQIMLAQQGMEGVLVNANGFYEAVLEFARLNDIPNPEQYLIDPMSDASKKALNDKNLQAQDAKMKQDATVQTALALEKLKQAFEKYKTDVDTQFKYFNAALSAEVAEAQIVGTATTSLLNMKEQAHAKAGSNGTGNSRSKDSPSESKSEESVSGNA